MRPLLKIRLTDKPDSHDAVIILNRWKEARQLATHLPRAIRLYAALLMGDTSLLADYFPFLIDAIGRRGGRDDNGGIGGRSGIKFDKLQIEHRQKTEEELINDALEF